MARTACYALRRGGEVTLHVGEDGADTVVADCFWGPRWVWELAHELDEASRWPEPIGGGAALDVDGRMLTLFDGGPMGASVMRADARHLLAGLWGVFGWEVRWAGRGAEDLAAAVGLGPSKPRVADTEGGTGERALVALLPLLRQKHPPTHGRARGPLLAALARAGVGAQDRGDGGVDLVHGAAHGEHLPLAELLMAVALAGARGGLPPLLLDDPVVVDDEDDDVGPSSGPPAEAIGADWIGRPVAFVSAVAAANRISVQAAEAEVCEALVIALCEGTGVGAARVWLDGAGAFRAEADTASGTVPVGLAEVAIRAVDLLREANLRVPGLRKV